MLYHPHFIKILHSLKSEINATYFQVGFLSKEESKEHKSFENYTINFMSTENATGMTLYPTAQLKAIHGYDEYYNGWGSEDTDVHIRLQNAGHKVGYYTNAILMLHQWHPKQYRKANDLAPFHSQLEQINASYLEFIKQEKQIKANTNFEWGVYNEQDYEALNSIGKVYSISNKLAEVSGFVNAILLTEKNTVIQLDVYKHKSYRSTKQKLKKILGKKTIAFLEFEAINNKLLACLISALRNKAYKYQYNRTKQVISLIIKL